MSFDRMGRRVEYRGTQTTGASGGNTPTPTINTHHRFVYDNYLCIQRLDAANASAVDLAFVWDITEPVSTRPLIVDKPGVYKVCVTHDGNKNVAELISDNYQVLVHYDYSSFGDVAVSTNATSTLPVNLRTCNPFQFSSEYSDCAIGLVYYNFRHLNSSLGRWCGRDKQGVDLYGYLANSVNNGWDVLGMAPQYIYEGVVLTRDANGMFITQSPDWDSSDFDYFYGRPYRPSGFSPVSSESDVDGTVFDDALDIIGIFDPTPTVDLLHAII